MTLRTFKLVGQVDEQHRLSVEVPAEVPPGLVKVILEVPSGEEEEASTAWAEAVARAWADDWSDPREDIYSLEDGKPEHEPR